MPEFFYICVDRLPWKMESGLFVKKQLLHMNFFN